MFVLQANDVLRMDSYAEAAARWESVKVNKDGKRCLSKNKDLTIRKRNDNYLCEYYANAVVTFRPDNTVLLRTCGWTTPSTAMFIYRCTGYVAWTTKGRMYVRVGDGDYPLDGLVVDLTKDMPVDPTQEQRKIHDRVRAKELRAPYMPYFRQLLSVAHAVDANEMVHRAYREHLPPAAVTFDRFVEREILRGLDMIVQGDEQAKELVTNWLFWKATLPITPTTFGRKRHGAKAEYPKDVGKRLRTVIGTVLKELYKQRNCWTYEWVPLGEVAKPDLY